MLFLTTSIGINEKALILCFIKIEHAGLVKLQNIIYEVQSKSSRTAVIRELNALGFF